MLMQSVEIVLSTKPFHEGKLTRILAHVDMHDIRRKYRLAFLSIII